MKRVATAAFLAASSFVACQNAPRQPASAAASVEAPRPVLARILGKELHELDESGDYVVVAQGEVQRVSPVPSDAIERHYKIEKYTARADGASFTTYASYLDEEDGGNTYGWVEDAQGHLIAAIADSFIEALDGDAVARAIEPAITMSDVAALNAFLTKLVEEKEGIPENETGEGDAHLDVYLDAGEQACTVNAAGTEASCEVAYLQDRWNGTMSALLRVQDGKAVAVTRLKFDGSY